MSKIDSDFYRSLAGELVSKVGRLKHFTKHSPSIGAYHEKALKDTILKMLPSRFSIKTGFAYASKEFYSNQVDIIVVDENHPSAYFFKEDDFAIVHPAAIVCTVEVKTKLTKRHFLDAVKNRHSVVKTADAICPGQIPLGFLFSYSSHNLSPYNLDKWYREIGVPDELKYYYSMILSLEKGRLDLRQKDLGDRWGHYFAIEKANPKSGSLSMFLMAIKKIAQLKCGIVENIFEFADVTNQQWSREYFRYGQGIMGAVLESSTL